MPRASTISSWHSSCDQLGVKRLAAHARTACANIPRLGLHMHRVSGRAVRTVMILSCVVVGMILACMRLDARGDTRIACAPTYAESDDPSMRKNRTVRTAHAEERSQSRSTAKAKSQPACRQKLKLYEFHIGRKEGADWTTPNAKVLRRRVDCNIHAVT